MIFCPSNPFFSQGGALILQWMESAEPLPVSLSRTCLCLKTIDRPFVNTADGLEHLRDHKECLPLHFPLTKDFLSGIGL